MAARRMCGVLKCEVQFKIGLIREQAKIVVNKRIKGLVYIVVNKRVKVASVATFIQD